MAIENRTIAGEVRTKAGTAKPVLVTVTDPDEIAAIRRNEIDDPIGGEVGGMHYAYRWSLERWRATQAAKTSGGR